VRKIAPVKTDRISAPLALHEVDAITNSTRDASQSANDQDQSLKADFPHIGEGISR
jgi:hypothetical protein